MHSVFSSITMKHRHKTRCSSVISTGISNHTFSLILHCVERMLVFKDRHKTRCSSVISTVISKQTFSLILHCVERMLVFKDSLLAFVSFAARERGGGGGGGGGGREDGAGRKWCKCKRVKLFPQSMYLFPPPPPPSPPLPPPSAPTLKIDKLKSFLFQCEVF